MKPYYENRGITIYHGDCREILPGLPEAEVVLTDPPYGMNYQSNYHKGKSTRHDKIAGDEAFPLWMFDLLHPSVAMFVWCRWDMLPDMPLPKSFIVWDKCIHTMGDLKHAFGRQWEGCAFYPGENHSFVSRPVDLIRCQRIPSNQLLHPAEKPVDVLKPLVAAHSADTILDPFMGVGTTLVAAKHLGRKGIGIELEEKYCEIAAKRLGQEVFSYEFAG